MRVLAFEDSVDIEALLISGGISIIDIDFKQYFESSNYLEKISSFDPEILLLDHFMPPTKGLDLLKGLLNSNIKRPKIIVGMSSSSMANNAMLSAGADFGITKFDLPKLEIWENYSS